LPGFLKLKGGPADPTKAALISNVVHGPELRSKAHET
jgi:hypothetical protein